MCCCAVVTVGKTLITVAEYQKRLGGAEREFLHTSAVTFLSPLRNFLEGDWRTISVSVSYENMVVNTDVLIQNRNEVFAAVSILITSFRKAKEKVPSQNS